MNFRMWEIPKKRQSSILLTPVFVMHTLFQQQLLCIIFTCFRQRLVFTALLITGGEEKKIFLSVNSAATSDPVSPGSNEFSPLPFTCPPSPGGKSIQSAGLLCAALINNEPSGARQRAWRGTVMRESWKQRRNERTAAAAEVAGAPSVSVRGGTTWDIVRRSWSKKEELGSRMVWDHACVHVVVSVWPAGLVWANFRQWWLAERPLIHLFKHHWCRQMFAVLS